MTKVNYRWLTSGLIALWFIFSVSASALGLFRNDSARLGLGIAIAATTPLLIFFLWFAGSPRFREFTLSLDSRLLTIVQTWRIVGSVFLVLYGLALLPGIFALPAGWGDVAIGVTAPFVTFGLLNSDYRRTFIAWQALGMLDLVTAVTLGATAGLIYPNGIGMTPMTVLPLSVIPTFFVPLFLMLHVISIAQTIRRREQTRPGFLRPLHSAQG